MGRIRVLARRHPVLLAAFVAAVLATGFFGVRGVARAVYWSQHRDEPIAGWMTIGYLARSYDVPRDALLQAAGLPADRPDRRTLDEIARAEGRDIAGLEADLAAAIAAARAARGDGPEPP